MSKYLFVETRDPFESKDTHQLYGLVKELAGQGHDVALYLTQNGVFATRNQAKTSIFPELVKEKNVTVFADDYSLEERGITKSEIFSEVKISPIDKLAELTIEDGRRPVWH